MSSLSIKSLLALPAVFNAFSRFVGADGIRRRLAERSIRAAAGDAVLDIGCGTAEILDYLPGVRYTGLDPSAQYIESARRRFGAPSTFLVGTTGDCGVPPRPAFDIVLAIGVLHHVDDAAAVSLLEFARSVLKPGGRFVSMDGCFSPSQSRLARFVVGQDRGRHVRPAADYRRLASQVFPAVSTEVADGLLRIPYTHLFMECSCPRA